MPDGSSAPATGGRYTLGYQIVGEWLTATGEVDGDAWVNVPADAVLAAARGRPGASLQ